MKYQSNKFFLFCDFTVNPILNGHVNTTLWEEGSVLTPPPL